MCNIVFPLFFQESYEVTFFYWYWVAWIYLVVAKIMLKENGIASRS